MLSVNDPEYAELLRAFRAKKREAKEAAAIAVSVEEKDGEKERRKEREGGKKGGKREKLGRFVRIARRFAGF